MMSKRLCNVNPYFTNIGEIGTTTRKGTKWECVQEGEIIDICFCPDGTHTIIGTGEVSGPRWKGMLKDIPIDLVEKEHDIYSRTYQSLLDEMKKAYSDFDENSIVFVFTYKRIS